ncbi:hypothetical protein [Mycobacterium sp. E136]|uniref:hypothetical protein n=1 Tax=Mycobacterium sp. E136 TaxID=1834125 RepID=UPI001E5AF1CC|nr:hypothetical protein [Mycobacterium sp. E136]
MITGHRVPAAELREWGVAASVVPAERLHDEALRYARAIAHHSADGLMVGKHALITFWHAVENPAKPIRACGRARYMSSATTRMSAARARFIPAPKVAP